MTTGTPLSDVERAVLADVPARYPVSRIDRAWLFPSRHLGEKESGLLVLSLFPGEAERGTQRLVATLHFEAAPAPGGPRRADRWAEQGWAPVDRVPRVISGVLARLGDSAEAPRAGAIGGDPRRWTEFAGAPAAESLDLPNGE